MALEQYQVGESAGDVLEAVQVSSGCGTSGTISTTNIQISIFNDQDLSPPNDNRWDGGIRFTNVTIPQGSTINQATLRLAFQSNKKKNSTITVWAHDVDDAPAFDAGDSLTFPSNRTRTTASAVGPEAPFGLYAAGSTPGEFADFGEITSIIQEIVNRPGWASGNAIALVLEDVDEGCCGFDTMIFNAWDQDDPTVAPGGQGSLAPTLVVDFTPPSGGPQTTVISI